jgi:hypothetical protein
LAKAFKSEVIRIKDKKMMELVKFFHGPFSHYGSNISIILMVSLLLVYNANHPGRDTLVLWEIITVVLCGIVLGAVFTVEIYVANLGKVMRRFLPILLIFLIYYQLSARTSILQAPLSLFVLSCFITASSVLFKDVLGPKKHWFMNKVDNKLVSVDKDWSRHQM